MASPALAGGVDFARVIRRNTLVLAGCLALAWSIVQLAVALGAVTLSTLTGRPALAGVAPGVLLGAWALSSFGTGRVMDRWGRGIGVRLGFGSATLGAVLAYWSVTAALPALFVLALGLVGAGLGAANMARTGAADMYPPERRARGIALVLVGAAAGAILSPLLFAPLLGGVREDVAGLALPWLIAAALGVAGAALTLVMRVDPIEIARALRPPGAAGAGPARPLRTLLRLPSVPATLVVAVTTQAVMTMMMSLIGLVLVGHGHDLASVSISLSVHFLGMFALVLVVGQVVDRLGRRRSLVIGLFTLLAGVALMPASQALTAALPAMFLVGVGWNVAFVAATALLSDVTAPSERGGLLGFTEFLATGCGAIAAVGGAAVLGAVGLGTLALVSGAACVVALLVVQFSRTRGAVPAA
jgi:MFS family permease